MKLNKQNTLFYLRKHDKFFFLSLIILLIGGIYLGFKKFSGDTGGKMENAKDGVEAKLGELTNEIRKYKKQGDEWLKECTEQGDEWLKECKEQGDKWLKQLLWIVLLYAIFEVLNDPPEFFKSKSTDQKGWFFFWQTY